MYLQQTAVLSWSLLGIENHVYQHHDLHIR